MEPRNAVVTLFVLAVASWTTKFANGVCLLRRYENEGYSYDCFKSTGYIDDLNRAPTDVSRVTMFWCEAPTIRDRSFSRFGKNLEGLWIDHSGVERIEDDAFQGLVGLEILWITDNKFDVVKGVWFSHMPNIRSVFLARNGIKRIEPSFFTVVKPLERLTVHLHGNDLSCLPMDSLADIRTRCIGFEYNPFTWTCMGAMSKWTQDPGADVYLDTVVDFDYPARIAATCVARSGKRDEASISECVEATAREYLPIGDNYTVAEVCRQGSRDPPPFLDCTA